MADLHKAEAVAREAHSEYAANPHVRGCADACAYALRDLLAALDAARGEAVAGSVQSGSVTIPFWVIDYAQKIELFMRVNGVDAWAIGGIQSRDLPPPKAPHGALAVPEIVQQVIDEMLDLAPTCEKDWDEQLHLWAALLAAAPPAALAVPASKGDAERSKAWRSVCDTLDRVCPGWMDANGKTGTELAVAAIERLAAQRPAAAVPAGWVAVPRTLTAENGAKAALMGETFEGQAVPWTAVKAVHKAVVAWAERAQGVGNVHD